jgi:hypothetical protein
MTHHTAYQSPPPLHEHDALRQAMHDAHLADCELLARQGFLPPWINDDIILQEDEDRLLTAIIDNGGLPTADMVDMYNDTPFRTATVTPEIAATLGMRALANAQAVVNRALQAGWIERNFSEAEQNYLLDVTPLGMFMWEAHHQQKEWGDD